MNDENGQEKMGSVNPTRLLNRMAVRALMLEAAKEARPFHRFSRVSEATLINLNEIVRKAAIAHVKSMPSKGRTL